MIGNDPLPLDLTKTNQMEIKIEPGTKVETRIEDGFLIVEVVKEVEFKKGDYIKTFSEPVENPEGCRLNQKEGGAGFKKNTVYKIDHITRYAEYDVIFIDFNFGIYTGNFRHATAEEIKEFKNPTPKRITKFEDIGKIEGVWIDSDSNILDSINCSSIWKHKSICPSRKLTEAYLALCQLWQLQVVNGMFHEEMYESREVGRFGIVHDETDDFLFIDSLDEYSVALIFSNKEDAKWFVNEPYFQELLNQAKPLL